MTVGVWKHGSLVLNGVPMPPTRISDRTAQFMDARGATFQGFHNNGMLISTRFADTPQIHPMGEVRMVKEMRGQWKVCDIKIDGSQLLVLNYKSINESRLFILDVVNGAMTEICPIGSKEGEKVSIGGGKYSHTQDSIYLTTDSGSEFMCLQRYSTEGEYQFAVSNIPWNIEGLAVCPTHSLISFAANCNGISSLYFYTPTIGVIEVKALLPQGIMGGMKFSADGKQLGFSLQTATSPSDAYSIDIEKFHSTHDINDLSLVRWTHSEIGGLNPSTFVAPSLFHYESFDGLVIPCFRYSPRKVQEKAPVIIMIHGGPESQSRPMFVPWIQYVVNEMGLTVLVPNVRGSNGYGKNYLLLDNGILRENSVKDIGALLDWVKEHPDLDCDRVAVFGGSYGGYMVLASLIHYGSRLKCGIENVGISNWVTFLENTQPYRRDNRRAQYGDERDPTMRSFLQSVSPTTRANEIISALYVGQGLN
eukprot:Ihof_evm1s710 gene=Ihof_evmTU1s710